MSELSRFKKVSFSGVSGKENGEISVSFSSFGLFFSKAVLSLLNYPEYVCLFTDDDASEIAIVAASEQDDSALKFYNPKRKQGSQYVRWNKRNVVRIFTDMAGIELPEKAVRYYGRFNSEDKMIIFSFKKN